MVVCSHINEDKRKTESQVVMFDIVNDIDNCPVSISLIFFVSGFHSASSSQMNLILLLNQHWSLIKKGWEYS